MASDMVAWIVGDFFPFGDLISDVWLLHSLPGEKTSRYDCSNRSFEIMRSLLAVGTVIDAIPEVALLLAILAGLLVTIVLGPAYMSTGRNEVELNQITAGLWGCARRTITDGKSIANFIFHSAGEKQVSWGRLVDNIAWCVLVVPHLPFIWLLRVYFPGSPYYKIIAIQAIGGAITEVSSIFFAVVSGKTVAIVSAGFGMYSVLVSTLVALQRGLQHAETRDSLGLKREEGLADCLPSFRGESNGLAGRLSRLLALVLALGVPTMAFLGVHYYETGNSTLGWILMGTGFGSWLLMLGAYVRSEGDESDVGWGGFLVSVALVMAVLGIYWVATGLRVTLGASLLALGSVSLCLAAIGAWSGRHETF